MIITVTLPNRRDKPLVIVPKQIVLHFEHRLLEVAMTVMMLSISVWLMVVPNSYGSGSLSVLDAALTLNGVIAMYGLLGAGRMAALIANGNWRFYGPIVRATGALFGAFIWAQMAASLWQGNAALHVGFGVGIPCYATLSVFELLSMWRALAAGHGRQDN